MNPFAKLVFAGHVWLYQATNGKIGASMGGPVLLLTTIGAKSGRARTVPVMYFDAGEERVVVASAAGSPTHPAWFNNLVREPNVSVQVRDDRYVARAEVATGAERARLFSAVLRAQPGFADYVNKAKGREIPVVILKR